MGQVLCAGTQVEHGQKLGARIDGEPEHLGGVAQPGSNFILGLARML